MDANVCAERGTPGGFQIQNLAVLRQSDGARAPNRVSPMRASAAAVLVTLWQIVTRALARWGTPRIESASEGTGQQDQQTNCVPR